MSENQSETVVYGKPGCVQCRYTTRLMDDEGVPYQYVDISKNEVAHQEVKNLATGTALPLVVPPNHQPWQGFSPDKIRGLKRDNG